MEKHPRHAPLWVGDAAVRREPTLDGVAEYDSAASCLICVRSALAISAGLGDGIACEPSSPSGLSACKEGRRVRAEEPRGRRPLRASLSQPVGTAQLAQARERMESLERRAEEMRLQVAALEKVSL